MKKELIYARPIPSARPETLGNAPMDIYFHVLLICCHHLLQFMGSLFMGTLTQIHASFRQGLLESVNNFWFWVLNLQVNQKVNMQCIIRTKESKRLQMWMFQMGD